MSYLGREWKKLCRAYHFDDRIRWNYVSDGVYDVRGLALIDVDNTLTLKPTLTENWLFELYKDPKISRESPKINDALKRLKKRPWEVKSIFDEIFLGVLKKIPLKESLYIDTCLDAADNTGPPPRTRGLMLDLRDRGIERGVITYGVEGALIPWYNYKITVPAYLRGTRLIFKNGCLDNYEFGGPYGKASLAPNLVKNLNYSPDQVLAIDDDPLIDKSMVAILGIGVIVWLDKDENRKEEAVKGLYSYPGESPIILDSVEKNMQLITSVVDKWKRYRFVSERKNPLDIYGLNEEFRRMKELLDLCKKDGKNFKKYMRALIKSGENVINLGNPFVSTVLSGVDDIFSELRVGFHTGVKYRDIIEKAEYLCSLLEEQTPEFGLTEDYLRDISHMIS